jgi:membrane associated rhomboid family serine protease
MSKRGLFLIGLLCALICVGCFVMIPVMVPGASDPGQLANILGYSGGIIGAIGGALMVLALIRRARDD